MGLRGKDIRAFKDPRAQGLGALLPEGGSFEENAEAIAKILAEIDKLEGRGPQESRRRDLEMAKAILNVTIQ